MDNVTILSARHLTDRQLQQLTDGSAPEALRLSAAEHLSCCDACLQRFITLQDAAPLLQPGRDAVRAAAREARHRLLVWHCKRAAIVAAAACIAVTACRFDAFDRIAQPGGPPNAARAETPLQHLTTNLSEELSRWNDRFSAQLRESLTFQTDTEESAGRTDASRT